MDDTLFPAPRAASFVAIGDSFTEGLNDAAPDGEFRGWADRLASLLAAEYPGLRYANLAVRGKLLRQIVHEQLPAAVALSPGLVSIAGGGNDILRPGADPDTLAELFDAAVARLAEAGCRVLMFTGFDPIGFPVLRLLRGRIAAYNMHLRAIADARGCYLVDLWSMRFLREPAAWSPDRLHLTTASHQRIALRACEVLGVPVPGDFRVPPAPAAAVPVPGTPVPGTPVPGGPVPGSLVPGGPVPGGPVPGSLVPGGSAATGAVALADGRAAAPALAGPAPALRNRAAAAWLASRREDIRWAREYALPWVNRRLHHTSSGDGRAPKRPDLEPVTPT